MFHWGEFAYCDDTSLRAWLLGHNARMTTDKPAATALPGADYFDQWYADIAGSTSRDAVVARLLGLPAQFAEPPLAALHEFRRLLKPGGRLALTCWEAVDPGDPLVPPRISAVHLLRDLTRAGFADVDVRERPDWRRAERTLWEAVAAQCDPDAAMLSLQEEGRRSLETFGSLRRVFATATAP
jgi:SAM-dependent methyltransferase